MDRRELRACIMRIEGTNCERETSLSFSRAGVQAEEVHLKQLYDSTTVPSRRRKVADYHILVIPGGFSAGDYVRAGAIFASRIRAAIGTELEEFVQEGRPVLGICNGFQVLVELGFLPGFERGQGMLETPQAVLAPNDSGRFECRHTFLRHENRGKCVFTRKVPLGAELVIPCAHAEGKLLFDPRLEDPYQTLRSQDQVVFRYIRPGHDGPAGYPYNPNGSPHDLAGICNAAGNVMGMMPHPERVFYRYQHQGARGRPEADPRGPGDGRAIFESVIEYAAERF